MKHVVFAEVKLDESNAFQNLASSLCIFPIALQIMPVHSLRNGGQRRFHIDNQGTKIMHYDLNV